MNTEEKQLEAKVNGMALIPTGQDNPMILDMVQQKREFVAIQKDQFEFRQRQARMFALSGLFGKEDDQERAIAQAMVRIELGDSMGFSPAESLQGIYIVSDQLCVSSALRAARMQSNGFGWSIVWTEGKDGCEGCALWLSFHGKPLLDKEGKQVCVSFQKSDAEKLLTTIWEGPKNARTPRRTSVLEKDNWKMSPRSMYFARAITNAQRWYAPACLSANVPSFEEVIDQDNEREPNYKAPEREKGSISMADLAPKTQMQEQS